MSVREKQGTGLQDGEEEVVPQAAFGLPQRALVKKVSYASCNSACEDFGDDNFSLNSCGFLDGPTGHAASLFQGGEQEAP